MARIYGTSGNDDLMGTSSADTIIAYGGDDILDGGAGVDSLVGGAGNDWYVVDSASDIIVENANQGIDTVRVADGKIISVTLSANVENLEFHDGAGKNGTGNDLTNSIKGNAYANILTGGAYGNDSLFGYGGDDALNASIDSCYLDGGEGNDTLNSRIYSGVGGAGNDVIYTGEGNDSIIGGDGNDIYKFAEGDGGDIISDTSGTDKITFDSTVYKENVAVFMDASNNLFLDYGSTTGTSQIGVVNQATNTIELVESADGYYLSNTAINQLIQDMAAYATQEGISFTCVEDVKANANLMTMVASTWQAA